MADHEDHVAEPAEPVEAEIPLAEESDEEILALARKRFRRAADAESMLRTRMSNDLEFAANLTGHDQWDPKAVQERTADERPYLTIDRLSQPIYSLINQHRDAGNSLVVSPVDERSDPATAELYQGLLRNIEHQSHASLAYASAVGDAVRMGRGFVRIVPEFLDDRSFDQDLRIKRVMNAFSVYPDPSCQEQDNSDATFYFVTEDLLPDEHQEEFGQNSTVQGANDFTSIGDQIPNWWVNGHIRVAEYYYVARRKERLVGLVNAERRALTLFESELPAFFMRAQSDPRLRTFQQTQQTRDVYVRQIRWIKMNGVEILKRRDVPGKWIPIVPVIGEELFVNGERDYRGIVRGAKDAVKTYQVQVTALIEAVGLIPKAPFVAAAGQIKGFEEFWKNANVRNYAVLPYNELDIAGNLVPAPQRNPAMPPLSPLVAAIGQMDNDVKAATRFFDASLGRAGPEESGVAISARQRQGGTATAHYDMNFRDVSLAHIGRILVDLIPYYYDTARTARIVGLDDQPKTVKLNQAYQDEKTGLMQMHRLGVGTYDVAVVPGPGVETRRQETRMLLTQALQAAPQMFPLVGDLYMKALGLNDIAKRLEKALPPGIRESDDPHAPSVEELQAELAQLSEQLEQAAAEAAKATAELDSQKDKHASAERIAAAQVEQRHQEALLVYRAEIVKLQAQIDAKNAQLQFQARLDEITAMLAENRQERQDRALATKASQEATS